MQLDRGACKNQSRDLNITKLVIFRGSNKELEY